MKIDIFMKALLKTLFIWIVTILCATIGGTIVIYGVTLISNFIVAHNLSLVILVFVCGAILYMFRLHVNHVYKDMIK